jgi:hypothetical protein
MHTPSAHSYFVPGFGLSRVIIQSEIRYMCGRDAIARSYTLRVSLPIDSDILLLI